MKTLSITNVRKDIYKTVEQVNNGSEPILITNSKGKNAVLLSEEDYNSLIETIYIMSHKGTYNNIKEGEKESLSEAVDAKEVNL